MGFDVDVAEGETTPDASEGGRATRWPGRAVLARAREAVREPGRLRARLQVASIFVALAVLWLALAISAKYFLTRTNILNVFSQSAVVGILAAAFTLVLIVGEIDLSITSVQALAGTAAAVFIIQDQLPVVLGIVLVLGIGCLAGLINAYLIVCPRIPSFIVTLAMLGIAQGVAYVLTGAETVGGFPSSYAAIGQGVALGIPVPVLIALGVYVFYYLLLSQTRFGVDAYAVGGARTAANLAGVRSRRVITVAFVLSGLAAAVAGVVLSSELNAGQGDFGTTDLLSAIAAVVIGGTSLTGGVGSVISTAGGVLVISTINDGLVLLGVNSFWVQVAVGVIIIGAVMLDRLVKGELRLIDLVPGRG